MSRLRSVISAKEVLGFVCNTELDAPILPREDPRCKLGRWFRVQLAARRSQEDRVVRRDVADLGNSFGQPGKAKFHEPPSGRGTRSPGARIVERDLIESFAERILALSQLKNFTAKAAKIAKTRQLSSGQRSWRTEIFRTAPPNFPASVLCQCFEFGEFLCGLRVLCG